MSKLKADWQEEAKNLGIPLNNPEGEELTIAELEAAIKAKQKENPDPPPPDPNNDEEPPEAKQKSEEELLIDGLRQQLSDLQAEKGTLETNLANAEADLAEAVKLLEEWKKVGEDAKDSPAKEDKFKINLEALEKPLPKKTEQAIIENRNLRTQLNFANQTLKEYRAGWVDRESYNTLSKLLHEKSNENRKLVLKNAELEVQIEKGKSSDKKD